VDNLLSYLPPTLLVLAQEVDDSSSVDPNPETAKAAMEALSLDQKRHLEENTSIAAVSQSLGSLTMAFQDGGLPSISDALKIKVENGGFMGEVGCHLAVEKLLKHS
jgi:26S proteasome regulatory subunit N13